MNSLQAPNAATWMGSISGRWRYLPKLAGLLWRLAPWDLVSIGVFSFVSGLVPVGAILVLRGLVDSTVVLCLSIDTTKFDSHGQPTWKRQKVE